MTWTPPVHNHDDYVIIDPDPWTDARKAVEWLEFGTVRGFFVRNINAKLLTVPDEYIMVFSGYGYTHTSALQAVGNFRYSREDYDAFICRQGGGIYTDSMFKDPSINQFPDRVQRFFRNLYRFYSIRKNIPTIDPWLTHDEE